MSEVITPCSFAPVFPYSPHKPHKMPQTPRSPEGFPELPQDWLNDFELFSSSDNKIQLFAQLFRQKKWSGENAHRALVVLHGQGEHGGRYVHLPYYLKDTFSSIYCLDHRGHGLSKGKRGHVEKFDLYADDADLAINRFYEYLLERFGKAEIHVLGHSMGGQILARTLLLHSDTPITSATLSSPMFDLAFPVPKIKEIAGQVIYRILPNLTIPSEPLAELVSSDPYVCRHYKEDQLNHGLISSAFYYSYLEAKEDTLARAREIKKPVLVQIADGDRIINPQSIAKFCDNLDPKTSKTIHYPDFYHELYNEPKKTKVIDDLKSWVQLHFE